MFGLFKAKPVLSAEDTEFQVATYQWLLRNFGGKDFYDDAKLILPTKEYFPSRVSCEDEAAAETFNIVKKFAGMEEWPCRLEKQEEDVDYRVAPALGVQGAPHTPLGTFQANENNEVVITYNPGIVGNPTQLVAMFAHELAHYLTGGCKEAPPGGWDNWEFATDIAATFLGFGLFMTNSAFIFQQFTEVGAQGWQSNKNGYLSEAEHVFALAIFLQLKGIPVETALRFIKPALKKLLKDAVRQVESTKIIEELQAVQYLPQANDESEVAS